ncbi:MAG: hypothetical protein D6690_07180 [Nitrospirae bacterium]|nr:MAG: hypothetical protein D6690_07180 [Nitrospirota bacterium]
MPDLQKWDAHGHAPTVVLYHADCADGFGAAWALWKRFPEARFIPVKHGDPPPPGLDREHVVIVDFSYPREIIERLAKQSASLTILDHHVTAQATLSDLPYAVFDLEKSGATLAWEWAHGTPVPWLIQYIEDKDLWRWRLPASREINAALASYPNDFQVWDNLKREILEVEGRAILRYENMLVDKIVEEAIWVEFEGERVPSVYSPILTSQIGERFAQMSAFGVIWHQRDKRRYFSLRSRANGISVAAIAAKYGGGGHTHAAGFSVQLTSQQCAILDPFHDLRLSSLSRSTS